MSSPRTLPTRDGYDAWSVVYDDDANPLIILEERHFLPMLGDIRGRSIADIGCGTGRHAVRLASLGANVTALDFSEGMLAQARKKPGADRVRFIHHDLAKPLPLPDASFDRVICALVLDHIAELPALFRELGRICKPEGFILLTIMHPAMMLKGVQARFTDPASGEKVYPRSVPNQISDYVTAALADGLTIDHISEHPADEALVALAPRAAPYLGWPMLLLMRLRR